MTVLEPVIGYLADCKGTTVQLEAVVSGANMPRRPVLRVMDNLTREGFLREIADDPIPAGYKEYGRSRRNPTWEIIKPVINRQHHNYRRNKVTDRDRIWRAIRAKRRFSRSELEITTGCNLGSVVEFTKLLAREGFIRSIGRSGREKVWMLVRDHGPKRPKIKDRQEARQ